MCTQVERTPIKLGIKRKAITIFTDNGMSIGGWFAFPRPDYEPQRVRLKNSERQLWCPYCGQYTVFKKRDDRFFCQGSCGWANTEEFYVKYNNSLWRNSL